jgi:hypothetical protein
LASDLVESDPNTNTGGPGIEADVMEWSIYPNPCKDHVFVYWERPKTGTLICLDEKESKVGVNPIAGQSIVVSTGAWSAAVNSLTLVEQNGQISPTMQLIIH